MTRIRLVWQTWKCFSDVWRIFFNVFCGTLRTNPANIAILPVKSLFSETTWFMFCPTFGTLSSCAPIALIVDSYWSSWKLRSETCKSHFQSFDIFTPFFAAKTVIYPSFFVLSKQRDMVHVLSVTRALKVTIRGGRRTKDCSQTWSFGFQFRLGKHFWDERGLLFYYLKIGFLEYLRIIGEIRNPNGPIYYWKKVTIWKEACIVHVGAVIHDYQGEGASWSRKCLWWKYCPGDLTSLNTDNSDWFGIDGGSFICRTLPQMCKWGRSGR